MGSAPDWAIAAGDPQGKVPNAIKMTRATTTTSEREPPLFRSERAGDVEQLINPDSPVCIERPSSSRARRG